jgi:RNA polymerase subunit RPABC4/transcription elongation factor Spt4
MVERFVKLFDITEKGISGTRLVGKEEADNLRGKIVVLNPEQSEIAQKFGINSKGVYGARFR